MPPASSRRGVKLVSRKCGKFPARVADQGRFQQPDGIRRAGRTPDEAPAWTGARTPTPLRRSLESFSRLPTSAWSARLEKLQARRGFQSGNSGASFFVGFVIFWC
jgi:hypothetical protein